MRNINILCVKKQLWKALEEVPNCGPLPPLLVNYKALQEAMCTFIVSKFWEQWRKKYGI
jgi:hypothetical protein